MALQPVFASQFGAGVQAGGKLRQLFNQGRQRSKLAELEQMIRAGDFQNAGATAAGLGQIGAGVGLLREPENRRLRQQAADLNQSRFDLQKAQFDGRVAGSGTYLTPVQGINPNTGKPGLFQPNKNGGGQWLGIAPNNPTRTDNTGTNLITRDSRTGKIIDRTPIENEQAASDKKFGAERGASRAEAVSKYNSLNSKMPGLRQVTEELAVLADKATYTYLGQAGDFLARQAGLDPSEGALARTKYGAMVDNQVLPLLRDTFGAAFTVKEGESLRATLGDPDKTPQEKKLVLDSFIEQKTRDLEALATRTGQNAGSTAQPPGNSGRVTQGDFDAMPSGTEFFHNGKKYRKP